MLAQSKSQNQTCQGPLALAAIFLFAASPAFGQQPTTKPTPPATTPARGALNDVPPAATQAPALKGYSSILPEGKTLPAETFRVRVPLKFISGSKGYDQDGNKTDAGFDVRATGAGLVVEYGLDSRTSLQFLAPVIIRNELKRSDSRFLASEPVTAKRAALTRAVASSMLAAGQCSPLAVCEAAITSGTAKSPVDTVIPLSATKTATIPAGVPFNQGIDAIVDAGALADPAANPEDGKTGLGDVQIGVLYALIEEGPVMVSVGGGLRFPTGSFKDVDQTMQRPTGRGTTDAGLRLNIDIPVIQPVMLSWQNQSEVMIAKGKIKAGTETVDFERKGVRHLGFFKAGFALAALTDTLKPVGLYGSYNYDIDGEERIDGFASGIKKQARSASLGLTVSGLERGIPLSLDLEHEGPMSGSKNVPIATSSVNVTVKTYYKF